jgi:hypothetical protein
MRGGVWKFFITTIRYPKKFDTFDGYVIAVVRIVDAPTEYRDCIDNQRFYKGYVYSLARYVVHYSSALLYCKNTSTLSFHPTKHPRYCDWEFKPVLDAQDLLDLTKDGLKVGTSKELVLKDAQALENAPEKSDVWRLPYVALLMRYLAYKRYDSDARKKIRALLPEKLEKAYRFLRNVPWKMVMPVFTFTEFGLPPLTQSMYYTLLNDFGLARIVPDRIRVALKVFFELQKLRTKGGHTFFSCKYLDETIFTSNAFKEDAMQYLYSECLSRVDDDNVAFTSDLKRAEYGVYLLKKIQQRHEDCGDAQVRSESLVPKIPKRLNQLQTAAAQHIVGNWLTLVEGGPGTGKTAVGQWLMSRYRNILFVSFTGMMVRGLRGRAGDRDEAAHTIHHILAHASRTDKGKRDVRRWLNQFDVIAIDEFSNVSMPLFIQFMSAVPAACKLVVFGDLGQLYPIEEGCPFFDMRAAFPMHTVRLEQNMRVAADEAALATAARYIRNENYNMIQFDNEGPLRLLAKSDENLRNTIASVLALPNGADLMNMHTLVVVNKGDDGRISLNARIEAHLIALGALPRHTTSHRFPKYRTVLFVGKKIAFTQNYNSPVKVGNQVVSDTVSNGELAVITSMRIVGAKTQREVILTLRTSSAAEKQVVISEREGNGVSPEHITDGYVSTTYKYQGQETDYILYWPPSAPKHARVRRPHAYVAVSRAKKRFHVFCTRAEFNEMCQRPADARYTVFGRLLKEPLPELRESFDEAFLQVDPDTLVEMPNNMPCAPILQSTPLE